MLHPGKQREQQRPAMRRLSSTFLCLYAMSLGAMLQPSLPERLRRTLSERIGLLRHLPVLIRLA